MFLSLAIFAGLVSGNLLADLPPNYQLNSDWHLENSSFKATVRLDKSSNDIVMDNGLVKRTFRIAPNAATVGFDNLMTGQSIVRSVKPEGSITIQGVEYKIGGLHGQPNQAFLTTEWIAALKSNENDLQFSGFEIGQPQERMKWKRVRHHAPDAQWPPSGCYLRMDYRMPTASPDQLKDTKVSVHYELYDGIPVFSKWITVTNVSTKTITIDRFTAEILAVVEQENQVELRDGVEPLKPDVLHVETDMAFGGFSFRNANRHTVKLIPDPEYGTQVNYLRQQPCLLKVSPTFGPSQDIAPGGRLKVFAFSNWFTIALKENAADWALRKMYRQSRRGSQKTP